MALEAVAVQQDLFGYSNKDLYSLLGGNWSCNEFGLADNNTKEDEYYSFCNPDDNQTEYLHHSSSTWSYPPPNSPLMAEQLVPNSEPDADADAAATMAASRPKRRRPKSRKNKEQIENQRMTHIAVERNRRKQMNEYLSVLRSLMPDSYVQRGDQASIIGGAINYVKELEQRLQLLGGEKHVNQHKFEAIGSSSSSSFSSWPFAEFFSFPQYSISSGGCDNSMMEIDPVAGAETGPPPAMADIEVSMVESHANLKIRSKRRPKQLLKMVSGLQCLRLTILHLNVSTADQVVLYSLSVKVEDDCKLTSVEEIATAVNQMLARIQQEAAMLN
ncbi:transcription factor bHLH94-like [Diospyros lotus]|uniref:transcription factor bHLH94-like n=1 Tax=Diospyros lotus TaxID=55363 RepID=UPI002259F836|nr:transcription factor bHLH94-like [Diospyros lotus]